MVKLRGMQPAFNIQPLLSRGRQALPSWSKKIGIPLVLVAMLVIGYGALYLPQANAEFRYDDQTCLNRITLLPEVGQITKDAQYQLSFKQQIKVSELVLASRQVCVTANQAPKPGQAYIAHSLYGGWLGLQRYQINTAAPPTIGKDSLAKPLPLSKPLTLNLSSRDLIHSYQVEVGRKHSLCQSQVDTLQCDLAKLGLKQGSTYDLAVVRLFEQQEVETIVEESVEILKATKVIETSIKDQATVYDKPQKITISFDKPLHEFDATFKQLGEKDKPIPIEHKISKKQVTVIWESELPRRATFEVRVKQVEAVDGSSLAEPYTLTFTTSGGPKVTAISIPSSGVALGSTAIISFDQDLQPNQGSHVSLAGQPATIAWQAGKQIAISLADIGKCVDFTLKTDKAIASRHGISGDSAWQFSSRTICHTIQQIGTSVQGRPILAYIFGQGSTAILYTGAIHGNEISSSYLMDNWIKELEANARALPVGRKIVVIPEVNPDGVAAGTRNNANNVDLNRNFDVSDWQSDITDTWGNPIPNGGGKAPMSEPETKALANFTTQLRPKITMSFHSIGGLVIANQAGNSSSLASRYASLTGYRNATGQSSTTFDYAISGTYDDWIAEKLDLPSVLVELGSHTYSQFPLNVGALWQMARH